MDKEDIRLIHRAQEDSVLYEDLYTKYADRVFNYFWYRVGHNKDVAEDLMQETFLRAYKNLKKFRLRAYSYYSYLLTIAHNLLVNYYRKPQPMPLESVEDVPYEITEDLYHKHDAGVLWRAVQQLPEHERDILLMKYKNGLKIKEIARIVGKSENAVKLVLSRTRKKLKKHPYLKDISHFSNKKRKHTKARFLK